MSLKNALKPAPALIKTNTLLNLLHHPNVDLVEALLLLNGCRSRHTLSLYDGGLSDFGNGSEETEWLVDDFFKHYESCRWLVFEDDVFVNNVRVKGVTA